MDNRKRRKIIRMQNQIKHVFHFKGWEEKKNQDVLKNCKK